MPLNSVYKGFSSYMCYFFKKTLKINYEQNEIVKFVYEKVVTFKYKNIDKYTI